MALKRLLVTSNDYDKWFDDVVRKLGLCKHRPKEYPCVVCWNNDGPDYEFVYLSDFVIE